MSKLTRRNFLKTTAAASTVFPAVAIGGTKSSGKVIGANDTIRIAVAGLNTRGAHHIRKFSDIKNVQINYLIDPDSTLYDTHRQQIQSKTGSRPKCIADVREALDDKNVDVISIATPNHWHSLMTIWACQAGKDVYVEKPLSHNLFEGRKCVEAARKYGRVVQHGTQQRSHPGRAQQISAIQSGKYGKLLVSKGYCCKPRWSIGIKKPTTPPSTLNFNLWLGPAPRQPFHQNLVHYNWHWFWDMGCGDIGNQGVHELDVARWAIKGATLPKSVWSLGGRFGYKDQAQTPNTLLSVYDYGETLLVFETRGLVGKHKGQVHKTRNEFYTTEGVIRGDSEYYPDVTPYVFYPKDGSKPAVVSGGPVARVTPGGPFGSFIRTVRTRDPKDCNVDVETGHYSSALCHLGNISYRLGKPDVFGKKPNAMDNNKQVADSFEIIQENLRVAGIDPNETSYVMGRTLSVDVQKERFIDDDTANLLLTRDYRKPYIVPDQV